MTDFNKIKITLKLSIGFPVANREEETFLSEHISEEEWNKLGFFEKDEFIQKEILSFIDSSSNLVVT
jgi:hypothetical protein